MSTVVSWNSVSYTIPATGEENWGGTSKVDGLLISLATNGFNRAGGTFTLSADADFGATAGLKAIYYKSRTSVPATTGIIRVGNNETIIGSRNAANDNNVTLKVNTSDEWEFNKSVYITGLNGLFVGTATTLTSVYEQNSILYDFTTAGPADSVTALYVRTVNTSNTAFTTNISRACVLDSQRAVTANVTDTGEITSVHFKTTIAVDGGHTYTNSNIISGANFRELTLTGAGAIAANFATANFNIDSTAVTGRKARIFLGASTGASVGDCGIVDNWTFAADHFINSTSTDPTLISGIFTVSNTTAATSTSTGSIITTGGLGVAKKAYFGDTAVAQSVAYNVLQVASTASITALAVTNSLVRLSGVTATTLHGFVAAGVAGQIIKLVNPTGQNLTIKHGSGSSSFPIVNPTGADVVSTGDCNVEFLYDGVSPTWRLVSFLE